MRKPTIWFLTRSDTNQPVQSQKQARGLKFWIEGGEELFCGSSKNKGTDQLCSYCTADLLLWFCTYRLLVFLYKGSYVFGFSVLMVRTSVQVFRATMIVPGQPSSPLRTLDRTPSTSNTRTNSYQTYLYERMLRKQEMLRNAELQVKQFSLNDSIMAAR